MLLFKDIQDLDMISSYIDKEDLAHKFHLEGNYFACIDDDDLVGLCKIQIKSDKLVLIYMHFKEDYRLLKLESALLKSLLFRFHSLEYKEVFSLQKNKDLDNMGFKEIDGQYKLILKDFLTSDCGCGVCKDER